MPKIADRGMMCSTFVFLLQSAIQQAENIIRPRMFISKVSTEEKTAFSTSPIATEPITPTTIGFKKLSVFVITVRLLYLNKKYDSNITITNDGKTKPNVATNEPRKPPIVVPTKVAEFIAIGPGVICEIVSISVNSA